MIIRHLARLLPAIVAAPTAATTVSSGGSGGEKRATNGRPVSKNPCFARR